MKRPALAPWLVALVVFGPFVVALALYYLPSDTSWLPRLEGTRELFDPPVSVPAGLLGPPSDDASIRAWSLIYAKIAPCDSACAAQLDRLARVRAALGRDAERVVQVLWYAGDRAGVPPGIAARPLDVEPGASFAATLEPDALDSGRVYLADPRGDLVVSYPPDVAQKELLRDLKRLLAVAN